MKFNHGQIKSSFRLAWQNLNLKNGTMKMIVSKTYSFKYLVISEHVPRSTRQFDYNFDL